MLLSFTKSSISSIDGGPEEINISIFAFFTLGLLIVGLLIGLYCISRLKSEKIALGGSAQDAFRHLFNSADVRQLAFYMFLFTSLMTIHWITSAIIFEKANLDVSGTEITAITNVAAGSAAF